MADRELRLAERRARGPEGAEALLRQRLRAGHCSGQLVALLARLGHAGAARALGLAPGGATGPREWLSALGGGTRRARELHRAVGVRLGLHAACWVFPLWDEVRGRVEWDGWWGPEGLEAGALAPLRAALDLLAEWVESPSTEAARRCRELGDRTLRLVRPPSVPRWVRPRGPGWHLLEACGTAARLPAAAPWRAELLAALEAATRAAQEGWGWTADQAWVALREAVLAAAAGELLGL